MEFTEPDLQRFAAMSGDTNPLHLDGEYARGTSFGRRVVHGVAASLRAFDELPSAMARRINRIRCVFRKPLFLGPDYDLRIQDDVERTILRWCEGDAVCSDIVVTWWPRVEAHAANSQDFQARTTPRDEPTAAPPPTIPYAICGEPPAFGASLMRDQTTTLAGLSYLVGMETPGRRALFTTIDVRFPQVASQSDSGPFFRQLTATYDERFARVVLKGQTAYGAAFEVVAMVRTDAQ